MCLWVLHSGLAQPLPRLRLLQVLLTSMVQPGAHHHLLLCKPAGAALSQKRTQKAPTEYVIRSGFFTFCLMLPAQPDGDSFLLPALMGWYCSLGLPSMSPAPPPQLKAFFACTSGQQVMLLSSALVSHIGRCLGLTQICPVVYLP